MRYKDQRVILARKWQELKSKEAMQNRIPERDEKGRVKPLSVTVSDKGKQDTRKEASKLFKVPERKLRKIKEIEESKPRRHRPKTVRM